MNKSIFKTAVAVAVTGAAVFFIGCGGDDDGDGGGGGKGNDIKNYKTVKISTQTWMAENLDNRVKGSVCYDNNDDNCAKYGSLYNWNTARTACPKGYRLPDVGDWDALKWAVGNDASAGGKLKSTSGWYVSGNGTDDYSFAALPGGYAPAPNNFQEIGSQGHWWTASEGELNIVGEVTGIKKIMRYNNSSLYEDRNDKTGLASVRCVADN